MTTEETGRGDGREPGRTGDAAGRTGETAGQAIGQTRETAGTATGRTGETARRAAGRTGETAGTATGRTGETARRAAGRTGETARRAAGQTRETARRAAGRTVTRLTDARALRAYAHPIRMKLVGLLRTEGPLTATRAGELIGESSGATSFHLRQLAKYGLVEEAGGGTGREKPWRATTTSTEWDATAAAPELAEAAGLLNTLIAEGYFEQLMRWLQASPGEPTEWQEAFLLGDTILYVTAEELAELSRKVRDLVDEYFERQVRPELRPAGSRLVTWLHLAFPNDFRSGEQR
jgi:predicted ArsR family transcriptional regulator